MSPNWAYLVITPNPLVMQPTSSTNGAYPTPGPIFNVPMVGGVPCTNYYVKFGDQAAQGAARDRYETDNPGCKFGD
jgi:hypothetical protein